MATTGLPTVVSDAYELLKWLVDHVGKWVSQVGRAWPASII
ncbi:MAG: hypothetical protein R3B83_09540 [Nitrospirales bacterium]